MNKAKPRNPNIQDLLECTRSTGNPDSENTRNPNTGNVLLQGHTTTHTTQQTTNGRSNGWRTNTAEDDEHNETGQVKVSTRHRTASKSSRK